MSGRKVVLRLLVVTLLAAGACPAILASSPQSGAAPPAQLGIAFFFSFVWVGPTSCYLTTGVCATTIVNTGTNSSYDLQVLGCAMDIITYYNAQAGVSQYSSLEGAIGGFVSVSYGLGPILQSLPFGAVANATCTIRTTELSSEPSGQPATGAFQMELVNSLGALTPGKSAGVSFQGTWMASSATTTVTSLVTMPNATVTTTSTVTATATTTATSTTTATTTLSSTGGLISELPYQLVLVVLAAGLVAVSYLNVRRRAAG